MVYFRVIDISKLLKVASGTPDSEQAKNDRPNTEPNEAGVGENVRAVRAANVSYHLG